MLNVTVGLIFEHSALCQWSVRVICAVLKVHSDNFRMQHSATVYFN